MNHKNSSSKFKIDWVLINELAIGRAPRKSSDLMELGRYGIKSILSLCAEKEAKLPDEIHQLFYHERFILPDHTYEKKLTVNDLEETLSILQDLKSKGPVYVHCLAGMERSPCVCMAWLIKSLKLSLSEALEYLMQVHKGTSPLPNQLNALRKLENSI